MKRILLYSLILLQLFLSNLLCSAKTLDPWTWIYGKQFSPQELCYLTQRNELIVGKVAIPPFSQLVFSWNAFRPEHGHYSFSVQVRDAVHKRWSAWHTMMKWGKDMQRSCTTKSDGWIQYFHVRLETGSYMLADGFRVKVETHEGADLSSLRGLMVSTSDFAKFTSELNGSDIELLPSVVINGVPKKSQMTLNHPRARELCSPTSTSMLVSYLCGYSIDPLDFAQQSFDAGLNSYGSWPFNMAHAFECCKGAVYFATIRSASFAQLVQNLARNIPAVVSVRGILQGAPQAYPKGHLLVVVGWDAEKKSVICHDPAFHDDEHTHVWYSLDAFLAAWERSYRLTYVAMPISEQGKQDMLEFT
jgi:hypothetical protein